LPVGCIDTIGTMNQKPVAIVTGAGRGIGRATAIELVRAGFAVALLARTDTDLAQTARLAGAEKCLVIPTDVADSARVDTAVAHTVEHFGRLDAVVNCAGHAPMVGLEETTDKLLREVFEINLLSAFYLCRAAWPIFRRQKRGAVVLVSSEAARDPFPGFSAYAAAKAAVNSLGLSLAREGAEIGVHVHVVAPGATETAMLRGLFTAEQFPTEKTLDPADVARVIGCCVGGELVHSSGEVIYLHR
jgi:NAD(P)-dependent dehydrogenase (short-subunit alcohol dehydrogenase family)